MNWRNNLPYLLIIGFFLFLFSSFILPKNKNLPLQPEQLAGQKISAFQDIKIEAKAAYVFDVVQNKPIFELNPDSQLPLASLAKIMTALAAKESFPASLLVAITREAVLQEGDDGFRPGEQWPASDLMSAMLISSSNDAAFAFGLEYKKDFNRDFISLMNEKAKELGLEQTYFLNPTGLDVSKSAAGAYGSAKDAAKLIAYIIKNDSSLMEATGLASINFRSREFKNTNRIIGDLPGLIAGKTGSSELAGGNLAVAVDLGYNHPVIIVVLGSTPEGRFSDVKKLYQAAVSDMINS